MVSGYLDPATPPVHAEAAAKTLPNAHQVVVRNGSHSFAGMTGCIDLLIASFLENPANPLDASCADKSKRPALWAGLITSLELFLSACVDNYKRSFNPSYAMCTLFGRRDSADWGNSWLM